jgi:hypothetical protein
MTEIIEVFASTGEIVERDFNEAELAQREVDITNAKAAAAESAALAQQTTQATASAIAHAKSLGFTDEMISVMYPNLGA